MTWNYSYTPGIWPPLFTALFLLALCGYSWRRHSVPGALLFAIGSLLAAVWMAGSLMETAAVSPSERIFWLKFQLVLQVPAVTAITCFILEYAWPGRWLTRRNLALLSILPLLLLGLVLTNDLHQLVWRGFAFDGSITPLLGPAPWVALAYSYALALIEVLVLAWLFLRSAQHRLPVVVMLTGLFGARAVFTLGKAGIVQYDLPPGVLATAIVFLAYAVALFAFRIFDPMPIARRTAIEQLHAGMLVLDPQGGVVSLNPSAEGILGVSAGRARGRPVRDLLPAYPEAQFAVPDGTEIEFSLPERHRGDVGADQEARQYIMAISLMKDWRGREVGRLLMLRDVTEQKQAQGQIVEQQRRLATLSERERMARDLHDSLGQVLGYASFQVEAAARLSRDGQGDAAAAQLDRLGGVIRDAHADVRQYILDLRSAPSAQQPFFTVVRQYLEGFTGNYDIRTHLSIDPGVGEEPLAADAQLHVFRILQEALANARKHSHARNVRVAFAAEGERVCMTVQDDGCGFAPEGGAMAGGRHFGLQFMQERAGQLGGSLKIQSAPGAGTRVVLEMPRKEL